MKQFLIATCLALLPMTALAEGITLDAHQKSMINKVSD